MVKTKQSKSYRLGPAKTYKVIEREKVVKRRGREIFQNTIPGVRLIVIDDETTGPRWRPHELTTGLGCLRSGAYFWRQKDAVMEAIEFMEEIGVRKYKKAIEGGKEITLENERPFPLNE